jgi:phospholipid/cholesterol/gamma-HCH transport system permease protein
VTAAADTTAHPRPGLVSILLGAIGAPVVLVGSELVAMARVFALTMYYLFTKPIRWREVISQSFQVGNRSVFFIAVVLGFLGMILIYQSGFQAERIVGDLQYLGALYLQMLFREFAPTITALMLATRVGTGIAAEIGSMVVTEQVDALRMNNAEPVHYLVVPRFIACVLMTLVLSCFALVVAYFAGMLTGAVVFDINPVTFYNTLFIEWGDLVIFVLKALAYGIAIPIIAAEAGLSAFGGSEGVGWATTKSVVNASLAVTFLDFVLSGFGYIFLFS